MIWQPLKR